MQFGMSSSLGLETLRSGIRKVRACATAAKQHLLPQRLGSIDCSLQRLTLVDTLRVTFMTSTALRMNAGMLGIHVAVCLEPRASGCWDISMSIIAHPYR